MLRNKFITSLKKTIAMGLAFCLSLTMMCGCLDEISVTPDESGMLVVELNLNTSSHTNSTKALTEAQEVLIHDLQILPFDTGTGILMDDPFSAEQLTFDDPSDIHYVKIVLDKAMYLNKNVTFMLLGNTSGNSSLPALTVGTTSKEDILNTMKYNVEETWPNDNTRHFPLYGIIDLSLTPAMTEQTVWMLRALARVQITVNKGNGLTYETTEGEASLFDLEEVYMYNTRTEGYFCPSTDYDNTHLSDYDLHMLPSFGQRTLENPISYTVSADEKWSYLRSIYTPENPNVTPDPEAVVMVVGGSYKGGETTYYKIPFKDTTEAKAFDILRNWSYDFNINGVNGPGKPTPEEALMDGVILDIEVKAWNEIAAKEAQINSPYELDVDQSMIAVNHKSNEVVIQVNTTYAEGWTYDVDSKSVSDAWYTVTRVGEGTLSGQLELHISANGANSTRVSHFTIHAGEIVKQINLTQLQENTSNCYMVSEPGLHGLNATVMGNGTYGTNIISNIYNKGQIIGTKSENIATYMSNAAPGVYTSDGQIITSAIHSAEIIWQTRPGLITKVGAMNEGEPLLDENGTLKYMVGEPLEGEKGGNALIGIKDADGNVIWSWHIWVIWDYEAEEHDLHFLTSGVRSGFFIMDRNLGAMENERNSSNPSDSYGLLYQWGRKDPMRGASNSTVPYQFTTTYNFAGEDNSAQWHAWSGGTSFADILTSVRNPMNYSVSWGSGGGKGASAESASSALWGNGSGNTIISGTANKNNPSTAPFNGNEVWEEGKKSIYDPCPLGYRVPSLNGFYFGISNEMANVVHYNYNFTTGIAGAEVNPYSYCDVDQRGYSLYYFGQYKDYEKYYTWMPMTPYYAGKYNELISPMAGSEGFAYTWLNCSDSNNASQSGMCIPWHPVNHHIHVYGEYSVERYNGGTIRCVRETDPEIIAATVPEKIVLLADGGSSMNFDVLTNRDWHIETNNLTYGWVSAQKDPNISTRVNTVTLSPNLTGEAREGLIYIVLSSGEKYPVRIVQESVNIGASELILGNAQGATLTKTFDIPDGGELKLPYEKDNLFSYSLTNIGQTYTFTVTTLQANASPIDLRPSTTPLSLRLSDGTTTYPLKVDIVQKGYSVTNEPVYIAATQGSTLDDKNAVKFTPPTGSTVSLPVMDDGWFTYQLTSKNGVYTFKPTAKFDNYGAEHTELPKITIGGYDYTVFVTQKSIAENIAFTIGDNVPGDMGDSKTAIKLSNAPANVYTYEIDGMPEWCTFVPMSGTITSNKDFALIAEAIESNFTGEVRSGTVEIKIFYGDVDVRTIEGAIIKQATSNIQTTGFSGAYNATGNIKFKNAKGYQYEVIEMSDWLNISSTTGTISANDFIISATISKPTVVKRTGYVKFELSKDGSIAGELIVEVTETTNVKVTGGQVKYGETGNFLTIENAVGFDYRITDYPSWLNVTSPMSGTISGKTELKGTAIEAVSADRTGNVTVMLSMNGEDIGEIVTSIKQAKK